ncbi:hypothetical protein BHE74_00048191 [Ensete ventricosum]|nr:hypothetical protein GW17_00008621 [Ensete ventricosum]RWW45922.1 hypothetical protein BHE74_00048191 [Ensete ventricosum]
MEAGVRSDRDEGAPTATADARDSGGGSRDADDAVRTGESAAVGAGTRSELQVVRWERFLPRGSLRILVVEHDDSTRHIVMALLRKCSYNVVAVADGLMAWEVLNEKRYNFDLVLTEVDIPSLSGIGLLSKIMAAEQCKNIPDFPCGKVSFRDDVLCATPTSSRGKSTHESGSSRLLELSLRRPQINGCVSLEFKEKHMLNHSKASAFSR